MRASSGLVAEGANKFWVVGNLSKNFVIGNFCAKMQHFGSKPPFWENLEANVKF